MPRRPAPNRSPDVAQGRQQLASAAAALIVAPPGMSADSALRKAARQLGLRNPREWPDPRELEQAVESYRRLFAPEQNQQLQRLQRGALEAMAVFDEFSPRLFGPLAEGIADTAADVQLILYSDDPDAPLHRLHERGLPVELGRWFILQGGDQVWRNQALQLEVDGIRLQLVVLPRDGQRQRLRAPAGEPLLMLDAAQLRRQLGPG